MRRTVPAVVALTATFARADTLMVEKPFVFPGGSGQTVVSLPRFDTMAGTRELLEMRYRVEAHLRADVAFENTMPFGISGWAHTPTYFSADFMVTQLGSWETPRVALAARDGQAGGGADYRAFDGLEHVISSETLISQPVQMGFVGTGTRPIQVRFIGGPWLGGDPALSVDYTPRPLVGTISAEYVYVPVPAPGVIAVAGLAIAGAVRRRRSIEAAPTGTPARTLSGSTRSPRG
jgi:hypothetical protein